MGSLVSEQNAETKGVVAKLRAIFLTRTLNLLFTRARWYIVQYPWNDNVLALFICFASFFARDEKKTN